VKRFKIDHNTNTFYDFAVYELGFLGFWWKRYESNKLLSCKEFVADARALPIFYP
jgi:hypothetical protein